MSSADTVGIDAGAVGRWFASLCVDFAGPLAFERVGLGQSNLTYPVKDQDGHTGTPRCARRPWSACPTPTEARRWRPLSA